MHGVNFLELISNELHGVDFLELLSNESHRSICKPGGKKTCRTTARRQRREYTKYKGQIYKYKGHNKYKKNNRKIRIVFVYLFVFGNTGPVLLYYETMPNTGLGVVVKSSMPDQKAKGLFG